MREEEEVVTRKEEAQDVAGRDLPLCGFLFSYCFLSTRPQEKHKQLKSPRWARARHGSRGRAVADNQQDQHGRSFILNI